MIIQTNKPGTFSVIAKSKGLKNGSLKVEANPPVTAGLALIPAPYQIKKNESTSVKISAVDKFGIANPFAKTSVKLVIDGPAKFENDGKEIELDIKNGEDVVKINSTGKKGTIILTALSDGLKPGKCKIFID